MMLFWIYWVKGDVKFNFTWFFLKNVAIRKLNIYIPRLSFVSPGHRRYGRCRLCLSSEINSSVLLGSLQREETRGNAGN